MHVVMQKPRWLELCRCQQLAWMSSLLSLRAWAGNLLPQSGHSSTLRRSFSCMVVVIATLDSLRSEPHRYRHVWPLTNVGLGMERWWYFLSKELDDPDERLSYLIRIAQTLLKHYRTSGGETVELGLWTLSLVSGSGSQFSFDVIQLFTHSFIYLQRDSRTFEQRSNCKSIDFEWGQYRICSSAHVVHSSIEYNFCLPSHTKDLIEGQAQVRDVILITSTILRRK